MSSDQGKLSATRFGRLSIVVVTIILALSAVGGVTAAAPDTKVQLDSTSNSVNESLAGDTTDDLTEVINSTTPSQETEPSTARSTDTTDTKHAGATSTGSVDCPSPLSYCPYVYYSINNLCTTCFGGGPTFWVSWKVAYRENSYQTRGSLIGAVSHEWEVVTTGGEFDLSDGYYNYNNLEYKVRYDNTTEYNDDVADDDSQVWVRDDFYIFGISSEYLPVWGETGVYCNEEDCEWNVIGVNVVDSPTPWGCNEPLDSSEAPSHCEVFDKDNPQISPTDPPTNPGIYYYILRLEHYGDYGLAYWATFGVWTDKSDSDYPRVDTEIGGVHKPSEGYTNSDNEVYIYDGRSHYGVTVREDTSSNRASARVGVNYAGYSESVGRGVYFGII